MAVHEKKVQLLEKNFKNDVYPIFVVGTNGSGKATFINALIRAELLPQDYDGNSDTSLAIIDANSRADSRVDFHLHMIDKEDNYRSLSTNSPSKIRECFISNDMKEIMAVGDIKGIQNNDHSVMIIEIPASIGDTDSTGKTAAEMVIDKCTAGQIIYLMNEDSLFTTDESLLLKWTAKKTAENPNLKLIFAINQMDSRDHDMDNSEEVTARVEQCIQSYNIKNIVFMPISARNALYINKCLMGNPLTQNQTRDLQDYLSDLNLNSKAYNPENDSEIWTIEINGKKYTKEFLNEALQYTGFPSLERFINDTIKKTTKEAEQEQSQENNLNKLVEDDFFGPGIDVNLSRVFPVIVMATMSSGKSTLINALLSEDIMPNKNEACTAKLFYVLDDDTAVSDKLYITKKDGSTECIEENLNEKLIEANDDENVTELLLAGQIKGVYNTSRSLLMIDTPGPNNSLDKSHEKITRQVMSKVQGGLILYVMNASHLAVEDDEELLEFVSEQMEKKPDMRIMFVLNKVDELDEERESILKYMLTAQNYLKKHGFENPDIIPVSALAAALFQKVEKGTPLTRKERRNFQYLYDIFSSSQLNLGVYSMVDEISDLCKDLTIVSTEETSDVKTKIPLIQLKNAFDGTGIPELERKIQSYQITSSMIDPLKINIK